MKRELLELLTCPHCRTTLELDEMGGDSDRVTSGTLSCGTCGMLVPIERGFPFFTLADVIRRDPEPMLGTGADYQLYRERKFDRGEIEMYAAFHPFNESFRATRPLLSIVSRDLKPGDMILEPWARTGWTAAWLAERFPEQRIIALWEGDTSVLGYRGFAHWFAEGRRPDNLDVLFVHPDRGLPFEDGAIAAVFSHDCFHRFGIETFGGELLRVAARGAPIVLAHVHLSNSEPDPWFERGGVIRHGRDYRSWLDRVTAGTPRSGCVWSEGDLFGATSLPPDGPDTDHYNGLLLIAENIDSESVQDPLVNGGSRMLLNPLYQLHGSRNTARIDRNHLQGLVGHMLDRHPMYSPILKREMALSDVDWMILTAALRGIRADEISNELTIERSIVEEALVRLLDAEILLPVTASLAMHQMQRFHSNQLPPSDVFRDPGGLAGSAALKGPDGFWIAGDEIVQSLELIAGALQALGVGARTLVELGPTDHPLALLVMLAAVSLGSNVGLGMASGQLEVVTRKGRRGIPYGWDGQDSGFVSMLEAASPASLSAIDCAPLIYLRQCGNSASLRACHFLEAASSLRHAIARPHSLDQLRSVGEWVTAMSGLIGGSSVQIG